ncbi:MAG TPA: NADH-dependent [FeFe] hydrogenase, group A6 [Bacillota bacterium]|nr:NADH-dependent [FeFe] hydrogenase, group A6 [Bacillota bacterium]
MKLVDISINGRTASVQEGSTILQAAESLGIVIPTLCHHPDQRVKGVCRVCMVEIAGHRVLQPACSYPVYQDMKVSTVSRQVRETRQTMLELILAAHPQDCLQCVRNLNCELQSLTRDLNIQETPFDRQVRSAKGDRSTTSIVRNPDKCINCRRCIDACHEVQGIGLLYTQGRGKSTVVQTEMEKDLSEIPCVLCGQCLQACPVGAISEVDDTERVWEALGDPTKHVVVQTAPAIRVAIGEEFGLEPGAVVTGQLVSALRMLGFDAVFDTDFTADLTIIEEGHEFIDRLTNQGRLPMITSCSPGWVKYIEHNFPDHLDNLSTCKSPQQMFGALAKTYYAKKLSLKPEDVYVVSIMPCTAKKFEAARPEMNSSGQRDVDVVLTTRELARMLKQAGVKWTALPELEYDQPLGISTGAGVIFGATGGVMEAALRTVYEVVTGDALSDINFTAVRGMQGIKEATVAVGDLTVKVAVAHGLANARQIMNEIAEGTSPYHFIEIMCCPGGCIGGGGQPIPTNNAIREKRIGATYQADSAMALRQSHHNPAVACLYKEFLRRPLSHTSHELLHTHYQPRK